MTSKFGVVVKADPRSDILLFIQVDLILQVECGVADVNTIGDLFCRSIIEWKIVILGDFVFIPVKTAGDGLFVGCYGSSFCHGR